jgi:hypothetical protein
MKINGESFFSPGSDSPAQRDRWQQLHKRAQEHEAAKKNETAIDPSTQPMFGQGDFGQKQFKGTPRWGWDKGTWKDLNKSSNVEDRRKDPAKGYTTQQLNEATMNKVGGVIDTAKRGEQNYDSPLSKQAGFGDLAKTPLLDNSLDAQVARMESRASKEYQTKYNREPTTEELTNFMLHEFKP